MNERDSETIYRKATDNLVERGYDTEGKFIGALEGIVAEKGFEDALKFAREYKNLFLEIIDNLIDSLYYQSNVGGAE